MLKQMSFPFLICLVLSGGLGVALYLLATYSFFDFYTRLIVLACIFLLLAAVWAAFIAEWREVSRLRRARLEEARRRARQDQELEEQALREAAALLNGGTTPGEKSGR